MATRRESWGREQEILVDIGLRDLLRELLDFAGYRFVFQFEPDVQNEGAGSLCNELMDVLLHTKNNTKKRQWRAPIAVWSKQALRNVTSTTSNLSTNGYTTECPDLCSCCKRVAHME